MTSLAAEADTSLRIPGFINCVDTALDYQESMIPMLEKTIND
jgi:hypothetical protein